MNNSPFNPKVVLVFIVFAIGLFALSIIFYTYGTETTTETRDQRYAPDTYSISAIGYAGVYNTMRRMSFPVARSNYEPTDQAGSRGTLIVAEPELHLVYGDDASNKLLQANRLLLILPKWQGRPSKANPRWITDATLVRLYRVQQTLALVDDSNGTVIRAPWPQKWTINEIGITPAGKGQIQLIVSDELRPVVGAKDGMLIGEKIHNGRIVWVLSDPDVISNHGFGKGDNAMFCLTMIGVLRHWNNTDSKAPIVFDETVHGYKVTKTQSHKLPFKFPFSIIVILVFLTAILLGFAGVRRFGTPKRPEASQDFGKAGLIQNSARLLDYAGHHAVVMQRYVKMNIRNVGQSLHAPGNLSEAALAQWLDRVAKTRKIDKSSAVILATAIKLNSNDNQTLARLFKSAWDIYKWKGEMLNGSAINRRHS